MADKNIQMKRKKADGTFDDHFPITKGANVIGAGGVTFDAHLADYEYRTSTVVSRQIRLVRQSNTDRLMFKLIADIASGTAITISLDGGATSKPLQDFSGAAITELEKGFVEVVANASFFILRPKGGKKIPDVNHTITAQNGEYLITKGQHSGLGKVKATFANLVPGNVRDTINIGDVVGTLEPMPVFTAGETIQARADLSWSHNATVMTLSKQIRVARAGAYRVSFSLGNTGGASTPVEGQIYRNGSPIGVLRSAGPNTGYVSFSEDIAFNANDAIQLYTRKVSGVEQVLYRDFRVKTAQAAFFIVEKDQ